MPGTARPGLEVVSPYIQEPLSTLSLNSVVTAITHATLDDTLFLFAATDNGELVQVSLSTHRYNMYIIKTENYANLNCMFCSLYDTTTDGLLLQVCLFTIAVIRINNFATVYV